MLTLLKDKYLPWSEDITRDVWKKIIRALEEDGYTAYNSDVCYEDFGPDKILTYSSRKKSYKVYSRVYQGDDDTSITVQELLGAEEDEPWLVDIRKRYPIGTKFYPAHTPVSSTQYCVITTNKFRKEKDYIIALTEKGDTCGNPGNEGTTNWCRTVHYLNNYAQIIEPVADLIEEAKRRYPVGTKFKSALTGGIGISTGEFYRTETEHIITSGNQSSLTVYYATEKKWAEVVTPTSALIKDGDVVIGITPEGLLNVQSSSNAVHTLASTGISNMSTSNTAWCGSMSPLTTVPYHHTQQYLVQTEDMFPTYSKQVSLDIEDEIPQLTLSQRHRNSNVRLNID